jgi:MFS family permease
VARDVEDRVHNAAQPAAAQPAAQQAVAQPAAAAEPVGPPRPPARSGPFRGYREVFAVPGSVAFYTAGWLGRLPRSTLSLGAVLLVAGETGRFSLAAMIAAVMVIGSAFIGPLWSRAMDRVGQRRILAAGFAATLVSALALLGAVTAGLPLWTWFATALLLGASTVDIGSVTRARWSSLLPTGHDRHSAFSLESVADESVYVIGPPVVTLLAAAVSPALGFAVGLTAGLAGMAALILQRSTTPAVHAEAAASNPAGRLRLLAPLPPGIALLLPLFLGIGLVFGAVDLTAVGFADEKGAPAAAGLLLASFAVGSVVAALVFGLLRLRAALELRVGIAALAYAVVVPVVALMPSIGSASAALFAAGLVTAPLLISGMGLVESRVDRARLTEALAWPSTAMSVGVTIGSALSGVLIDAAGGRAGFAVAVVGALVAGVFGVVTLASHRARSQRVARLTQAD